MINNNGFTLIELMITLIVASILVAVAAPTFRDIIQNNRVTASTNKLSSALAVARSDAIRRRETVTICSSTDLKTCAGNTNWGVGWIIFNDRNRNGNPPDDDEILRVWESLPIGHTIIASLGATELRFDRLGAANTNERFDLSNPDCKSGQANRERRITMAISGTVTVERRDCP